MKENIQTQYRRIAVSHLSKMERRQLIDRMKKQGWVWAGQQIGQYVFKSTVVLPPDQGRRVGILL